MLDIAALVRQFFQRVAATDIEIYNEFSLQHELGIYLRSSTGSGEYRIQFERPVGFFGLSPVGMVKSEIDLAVFTPDTAQRLAIELKYPQNGQYPEQMFKFCQDLAFLEQLVAAGFDAGYFVVAADDRLFYSGDQRSGIYPYFRGNVPIHGVIVKPTGKRDESVQICGSYEVTWREAGPLRYSCVAVDRFARPNKGIRPAAQKAGGG